MTRVAALCVFILVFSGCRVNYGFTGTSIDPQIKTVSIGYFENQAPLAKPTLSQIFTESLKDRFLQQTNLSLVKDDGDISFNGRIVGYETSPLAIKAGESAALNRLTIKIEVDYQNSIDDAKNFKQTFSRYEDYSSENALSDVEDQLIEQINEQIIQDIFNKSVSDW